MSCPECEAGGHHYDIVVTDHGEEVCTRCGMVVSEDMLRDQEWRSFGDGTESGIGKRVGPSMRRHDDAVGTIVAGKSRLSQTQQFLTKRTRPAGLDNLIAVIKDACGTAHLNVSPAVVAESERVAYEWFEAKEASSRPVNALALACVYVALKRRGEFRSPQDLLKDSNWFCNKKALTRKVIELSSVAQEDSGVAVRVLSMIRGKADLLGIPHSVVSGIEDGVAKFVDQMSGNSHKPSTLAATVVRHLRNTRRVSCDPHTIARLFNLSNSTVTACHSQHVRELTRLI